MSFGKGELGLGSWEVWDQGSVGAREQGRVGARVKGSRGGTELE